MYHPRQKINLRFIMDLIIKTKTLVCERICRKVPSQVRQRFLRRQKLS